MTIASIDEIMEKIQLKASDLDNATSTIIQKIFKNLTVEEISRLCRVSHSFNYSCKTESLWRHKILRDYGINEKIDRKSWRETAKILFIEEKKKFWDEIKENIDYYIIDPNHHYNHHSQIFKDHGTDMWNLINAFEKKLVHFALRDKKELYATDIILKDFYDSTIDVLEYKDFYVNFLPLFRKAAELSPGGKISLQKVLELSPFESVKVHEKAIDEWDKALDNDTPEDYIYEWEIENEDLYHSMGPIVAIYRNNEELFANDTEYGSDPEMGIMFTNYIKGGVI